MATAPDIATALPGLAQSTALDINTSFLLQSGYLVFFMHCGFAMVCPAATAVARPAVLLLMP